MLPLPDSYIGGFAYLIKTSNSPASIHLRCSRRSSSDNWGERFSTSILPFRPETTCVSLSYVKGPIRIAIPSLSIHSIIAVLVLCKRAIAKAKFAIALVHAILLYSRLAFLFQNFPLRPCPPPPEALLLPELSRAILRRVSVRWVKRSSCSVSCKPPET